MPVYLISYDLKFPLRDYQKVHLAIKALGSHIKPLESVWLVDTMLTSIQIRDRLVNAVDFNDKLIVIPLRPGASAKKLDPTDWNWIELHLR